MFEEVQEADFKVPLIEGIDLRPFEVDDDELLKVTEIKVELDEPEDVVNHPAHYTGEKLECIEAMELVYGRQAVIDFCLCNNFKYNWRADKKGGDEDLKKARWYMAKAKELMVK